MDRPIYACACLRNGKLFFWYTGYCKKKDVFDFEWDFYISGLNILEEMNKHSYKVVTKKIDSFDDDEKFYKKFKLHKKFDKYNAIRPY